MFAMRVSRRCSVIVASLKRCCHVVATLLQRRCDVFVTLLQRGVAALLLCCGAALLNEQFKLLTWITYTDFLHEYPFAPTPGITLATNGLSEEKGDDREA